MTPDAAYEYVRSVRPRVLLASSQWQAVQEYYHHRVKRAEVLGQFDMRVMRTLGSPETQDISVFDDGSMVVVTESDLDGYDMSCDSDVVNKEIWDELNLVYRVQFASQAALARLSCLWLRCHMSHKTSGKKPGSKSSCSVEADQMGSLGVEIQVY